MLRPTSYIQELRWISYRASANETIPPYAVLMPLTVEDNSDSIQCIKPNLDEMDPGLICFNGPAPVENGAYGVCTFDVPTWAAYEESDGAAENLSLWGTEAGSFKLRKYRKGFYAISGAAGQLMVLRRYLYDAAPPPDEDGITTTRDVVTDVACSNGQLTETKERFIIVNGKITAIQ